MRSVLFILLCLSLNLSAQTKNDFFNIHQPINFNGQNFVLSSSYNPQKGYYKQEYLPATESLDSFKHLFTIDLLFTEASISQLTAKKISEIEIIKKDDPIVQYRTYENSEKGEFMIDFLLSKSEMGKVHFVEWNVYRYTQYVSPLGKKGILLVAYSMRGYGDGINSFFELLKANRINLINKMGSYVIPGIDVEE